MTPREFGQRVYRLRMDRGLTQEELAEKAEITARTIQKLESYRILPSIETLSKLVNALQCDWKELLGEMPVIAGTSALTKRKPK